MILDSRDTRFFGFPPHPRLRFRLRSPRRDPQDRHISQPNGKSETLVRFQKRIKVSRSSTTFFTSVARIANTQGSPVPTRSILLLDGSTPRRRCPWFFGRDARLETSINPLANLSRRQ